MSEHARLYVFFGLIASGKSTLAKAWATSIKAFYYNSDRVRKELAGIAPETSQKEVMDQGIYTKEFSERTYDALLKHAEKELTKGSSVVLDGSYQNKKEREKVRELARRLAVRVYFVLCGCDEDEMKRRMEVRAQDPMAVSDGRWEVYLKQKERFEPPDELSTEELITIDTQKTVKEMIQESRINQDY